VKFVDKTYAEFADERLDAAKRYRKFASRQPIKRFRTILIQWARQEEERAASYYARHTQIFGGLTTTVK